MTTWLPDWTALAPFLVAALALNLTPGADMTYVLARSIGQGRRAGVLSALGVAAGSVVHTIAAAVGLSALLMTSETAFLAIKYAGAAYLLYLAWKALRTPLPSLGEGIDLLLGKRMERQRDDRGAEDESEAAHGSSPKRSGSPHRIAPGLAMQPPRG